MMRWKNNNQAKRQPTCCKCRLIRDLPCLDDTDHLDLTHSDEPVHDERAPPDARQSKAQRPGPGLGYYSLVLNAADSQPDRIDRHNPDQISVTLIPGSVIA